MRIRILVPALACLAAAPFAAAADTVPAVKIDGFVDSIWSNTNPEKGKAVGATSGFDYSGKLGLSATISDKVSAQVDLNISNTNGAVTSRQTYGTWAINDEISLKTGKFINNYGWTAAYAPGLYRVNSGSMLNLYGVDQVGADVKYTKGAIAAAVTVANGFFGEANGTTAQGTGQDAGAYAFGLDVVYTHGDLGFVNLELITDQDVGTGTDADGYHFGLNAQATPSKELTVAAELIMQTVNQKNATADAQNTGFMVLANYKLGTAMPMSVTGQITFIDVEEASGTAALVGTNLVAGDDVTGTEFAVALLTNPAGTDKLGANFEVSYTQYELNGGDSEYKLGLAAELLYVF